LNNIHLSTFDFNPLDFLRSSFYFSWQSPVMISGAAYLQGKTFLRGSLHFTYVPHFKESILKSHNILLPKFKIPASELCYSGQGAIPLKIHSDFFFVQKQTYHETT